MVKEKVEKRKKSLRDNIILSFAIGSVCLGAKFLIEIYLVLQNIKHFGKIVEKGMVISKSTIEFLQADMYVTTIFLFCLVLFVSSRKALKKYNKKKSRI